MEPEKNVARRAEAARRKREGSGLQLYRDYEGGEPIVSENTVRQGFRSRETYAEGLGLRASTVAWSDLMDKVIRIGGK
jgi:hypothetical protein